MNSDGEITRLISEWKQGDRQAADQLFELLYRKLREIASQCLRDERCPTLTPTALVHEAYLRLHRSESLSIADRTHLLALLVSAMRRILVDAGRAKRSGKRGGNPRRVELMDSMIRTDADAEEILAVDRALTELGQQSKRQADVVELTFFGGWSLEEAAGFLGISERTARRDWQVARTRLKGLIDGSVAAG